MGLKERDGEARAKVIESTAGTILKPEVSENVEPGSAIYTDTHGGDRGLDGMGFDHETVDHMESHVNGRTHANGPENFWSLLRRGLHGTYVSVDPEHLSRYLDERLFTYNLRDLDDRAALLPS